MDWRTTLADIMLPIPDPEPPPPGHWLPYAFLALGIATMGIWLARRSQRRRIA